CLLSCILLWFCRTRHLLPDGSPGRLGASLGAATSFQALFFGTGFERGPRTSNPSNRIEATGFAPIKSFAGRAYHCCPPFPRLTCFLARAEDGTPRVTHERFFGRPLRGSSARSTRGPGRSSRIGNSESLAPLRLIADRARRHFHRCW